MVLLWYMRHMCGLLDPHGTLYRSIPSQAIAQANLEVQLLQRHLLHSHTFADTPDHCFPPVGTGLLFELLHYNFFCMFYFRQCALALKIKPAENLTDKNFYRQNFPIYDMCISSLTILTWLYLWIEQILSCLQWPLHPLKKGVREGGREDGWIGGKKRRRNLGRSAQGWKWKGSTNYAVMPK